MEYPTIHLNGTSAEGLLYDIQQAYSAIGVAHDKLLLCAPHARDYYVKQDYRACYIRASDEHTARLKKLMSILEELGSISDEIMRQQMERKGKL